MRNHMIRLIIIGAMVATSIISFFFFYFTPGKLEKAEIMKLPRIDHLFEKSQTVCIGRFLIDVPEGAEVVYGPAEVPFSLSISKEEGRSIGAVVSERLTEIEKEREYAEGRLLNADAIIGRVMDGGISGQKIVFGVSEASGVFYRIQSFLPLGDYIFTQEIDSSGKREEYERNVKRLNLMASLFRLRDKTEIPQAPGICVENGFFAEPHESIREYVTLGIRLVEYPDVHFSISTTNKKKLLASDALEPRIQQGEENARSNGLGGWYSRIKTLRRGDRALGKWKGFEILARLPAQEKEGESHEFKYLSQGEPMNPLLPLIELELRTGVQGNDVGGVKPSLSDEEAVALWDRLTGSIRVRPVAEK